MELKLLEIRDRMTFIPVYALRVNGDDSPLLRMAGFGLHDYVILGRLNKGEQTYNAFDWNDRTMQTAHLWIIENWFSLVNGSVVDVQFILGETPEPCRSQLLTDWE